MDGGYGDIRTPHPGCSEADFVLIGFISREKGEK